MSERFGFAILESMSAFYPVRDITWDIIMFIFYKVKKINNGILGVLMIYGNASSNTIIVRFTQPKVEDHLIFSTMRHV